MFQEPKYRGSNFLMLQELDGTPIQPSYINGGAWLPLSKHSTTSTARMVRCITNHAPIGNYFTQFNIPEPAGCRHCASHFKSREHLLEWCYKRRHHPPHYICFTVHLVNLLDDNPAFFAQAIPYKPDGIG
ncbi:hypothetical protein BDN70DRAFT_938123 [Pholiota conissans]|uniref:Uncharacterized protein n=1 Tax=Pholiota conissans TaxID=109636 RepID=A0A9P6CTX2_9AGAR|nr:hypothetical protein BDN70DRAFT_938123 [Pholiota conissans]